ncbi:MAG: penicillin-binding protein 2 [Bacteroidales bacterium]|nr:penicillin-binding protein 2 [Bacteroidales bacterium]
MEQYTNRKFIILGIILLISLIISVRLFIIQVVMDYTGESESNILRKEVVYPHRGLIFDRNGELLVGNKFSYDLKIAPYELEVFDTTLLCELLNVDRETLIRRIQNVLKHPDERYNPIIKQLSDSTYGKLQERMYDFHGFYFSRRTLREYKREIASHLLGYVGEVDAGVIRRDRYYESGDYYGVSGVEYSYEKHLRGKKGCRYLQIDAKGREQGSYKEGRRDTAAQKGRDLYLTIDADLQAYGEKLMDGYRGSIVAIEPSTGEVLAYISAPSYDPSLLVGRQRETNYFNLAKDTLKPLYNYAIQAQYPPGSTFKPVNGLVALQEKVLTTRTTIYCDLGYYYTRYKKVRCHDHISPLNITHSVQHSCNAFFCHTYKLLLEDKKYSSTAKAYTNWRRLLMEFGLGDKLGIDLPYEKGGLIPDTTYYDNIYGSGHWRAATVISLAIGQGEILLTPLQMANMAATIANRGYYYTPHVVKRIAGVNQIDKPFTVPHQTDIDSANFIPIIDGMELAVNEFHGTAYWVRHPDFIICGKTGTAQNPHGKEHSVFMAFAPKDDPRIAISVYVEHGEYGARYAAPIASLMIEKYLTDSISDNWTRKNMEERMLNGNLLYSE